MQFIKQKFTNNAEEILKILIFDEIDYHFIRKNSINNYKNRVSQDADCGLYLDLIMMKLEEVIIKNPNEDSVNIGKKVKDVLKNLSPDDLQYNVRRKISAINIETKRNLEEKFFDKDDLNFNKICDFIKFDIKYKVVKESISLLDVEALKEKLGKCVNFHAKNESESKNITTDDDGKEAAKNLNSIIEKAKTDVERKEVIDINELTDTLKKIYKEKIAATNDKDARSKFYEFLYKLAEKLHILENGEIERKMQKRYINKAFNKWVCQIKNEQKESKNKEL